MSVRRPGRSSELATLRATTSAEESRTTSSSQASLPEIREVGAYPNPSNLAERLQRFGEAEAAEADRTDLEGWKRIRQAARALAEVGTAFAATFAAEVAKPY